MSQEQDKQNKDEQLEDIHAASADALAAMADGIHDAPDAEEVLPPPLSIDAPDDDEAMIALAGLSDSLSGDSADPERDAQAEDVLAGVKVDPLTLEQRRAHAANMAKKAKYVHAEQFKQAMIPLLLAAAGLLVLLGTWVLLRLPSAGQMEMNPDTDNLLYRPWARYAVLSAYPLAAILLLGAWLFRRDLQEAKK